MRLSEVSASSEKILRAVMDEVVTEWKAYMTNVYGDVDAGYWPVQWPIAIDYVPRSVSGSYIRLEVEARKTQKKTERDYREFRDSYRMATKIAHEVNERHEAFGFIVAEQIFGPRGTEFSWRIMISDTSQGKHTAQELGRMS